MGNPTKSDGNPTAPRVVGWCGWWPSRSFSRASPPPPGAPPSAVPPPRRPLCPCLAAQRQRGAGRRLERRGKTRGGARARGTPTLTQATQHVLHRYHDRYSISVSGEGVGVHCAGCDPIVPARL